MANETEAPPGAPDTSRDRGAGLGRALPGRGAPRESQLLRGESRQEAAVARRWRPARACSERGGGRALSQDCSFAVGRGSVTGGLRLPHRPPSSAAEGSADRGHSFVGQGQVMTTQLLACEGGPGCHGTGGRAGGRGFPGARGPGASGCRWRPSPRAGGPGRRPLVLEAPVPLSSGGACSGDGLEAKSEPGNVSLPWITPCQHPRPSPWPFVKFHDNAGFAIQ